MDIPAHLRNAFTAEQLEEHRQLFNSFDEDGGGTIDAEEMAKLAEVLGLKLNAQGAKALIEEIDLDGDGLVDFVEFLTLLCDLQRGGLDREKKKKSSQLKELMNLAVARADQVRQRKLDQIEEAQRSKEVLAERAAAERDIKAQNALIVKEKEKELIVQRNEAARRASVMRKVEVEREVDSKLQEKDIIIRQKEIEARKRAEEEKSKVFLQAQQKAAVTLKKGADSQLRKLAQEEEDELRRLAAESIKQEQRVVNARRADIERMFTRVQLEALREQFDEADADNSQSIDANELMTVCQKLGENLSMKQVQQLIAEVDDDQSGEIEWEEYLLVMGKKRDEAMKKGSGLFQKMSMRANEAAKRKQEKIQQAQLAKEAEFAQSDILRQEAVKRAAIKKAEEQKIIMERNIIKEEEAMVRVEGVEIEKEMILRQKAMEMRQKEMLGTHRAAEQQQLIWEQAEQKKLRTEANAERSAWMRQQKETVEEQERVEAEKVRSVKRVAKARRAEIERKFTRVQLEALREQFEEADTDNSQSIDANELMMVCKKLGENISMNQVIELIAEVDDDGSGEIEWEEYLIVMGKKREEALRKGSGLFQMMAKRASQAAKKKEDRLLAAQVAKEAEAAQNDVLRDVAVQRAKEAKEKEKALIAVKNEEVRLAAVKRLSLVEQEKVLQEQEKEKVMVAKREKALILAAKEKKAVFDQAKIKAQKTKEKAGIAIKRKTQLADEEERRKVAIEIERQKKREKVAKRGTVEKLFTANDLAALREQFDSADTDGSGSIDVEELGSICSALGENLTRKQLNVLIKEVDENGNGALFCCFVVRCSLLLEVFWILRFFPRSLYSIKILKYRYRGMGRIFISNASETSRCPKKWQRVVGKVQSKVGSC